MEGERIARDITNSVRLSRLLPITRRNVGHASGLSLNKKGRPSQRDQATRKAHGLIKSHPNGIKVMDNVNVGWDRITFIGALSPISRRYIPFSLPLVLVAVL